MKRRLWHFILASVLVLAGCQGASVQTAQLTLPDESDSGIGGTGLINDSGIGGTGVIGVITGFGSIWVNGEHIYLNQNTRVEALQRNIPAENLEIGHQVRVVMDADNQAQQVELVWPMLGRVTAVNRENGEIELLGQSVRFDAQTMMADSVQVGDWVRVNGFAHSDNHQAWYATRIEPQTEQYAYIEAGLVQEGETWRVSGIELPNAQIKQMNQVENRARVWFDVNGTEHKVARVEILPSANSLQRILVQDYPQNIRQQWRVEGVQVDHGLHLFELVRQGENWQLQSQLRIGDWREHWPMKMRQTLKPASLRHSLQHQRQLQLQRPIGQPNHPMRQLKPTPMTPGPRH
jgi:hypothetical protein